MSKFQWGAAAISATSIVMLILSLSRYQPQPAGPVVETSPGVFSQDFTPSLSVPTWAVCASLAMFGLAGAALSLSKK